MSKLIKQIKKIKNETIKTKLLKEIQEEAKKTNKPATQELPGVEIEKEEDPLPRVEGKAEVQTSTNPAAPSMKQKHHLIHQRHMQANTPILIEGELPPIGLGLPPMPLLPTKQITRAITQT